MTTQPTTSGTGNARAKGPSSRRYTAAQKEQAVRLVRQLAAETGKDAGAISRVAHQLGFGAESVRQWVRQADIDEGRRPGVTSSEAARIRDRVREPGAPPSERDPHVKPRLSSRRSSTARNVPRPPSRYTGGSAEPICRTLQVTPHTYYEARSRQPSARAAGTQS
jgi:transposase